jgi:AraC-like DNA-binding protein
MGTSHIGTDLTESHQLALFLGQLRATRGEDEPIRRRFRLVPGAPGELQVPISARQLPRALDAVARLSGDAFFGLHAALAAPRGFYGLLEYIGATTSTVRAGLEVLGEYPALVSETLRLRWLEAGGKLVISVDAEGRAPPPGRHRLECCLALLLRFGRDFTGKALVPDAVWFAHRAPPTVAPLHAFFCTEALSFGAADSGMVLPAQVLELPFVRFDPALRGILEAQAQAARGVRARNDLVSRVERAVRESLEKGQPEIGQVARRLHMSGRTLQRRLVGEGTSYREILERVRHALARAALADSRLRGNLAELGYRLGYTTQASFGRAYRRWTGQSPGREARRLDAAGRVARAARARP